MSTHVVAAIGVSAMLLATFAGMAEHSGEDGRRMILALQPAYVSAAEPTTDDTQIRRSGREEIHHTSASYGAFKRTASVSGSI